jgi:uncharacterized protein (TIGR00369 family)
VNLANDLGSGLSGLDTLRALIAANKHPPIAETLEFMLTEIDDGRAVFTGVPTVKAYNPIGTVHGGYAATMLDSACGCAVHSKLSATQMYTTVELKISYIKAITVSTGLVRAEGRVRSMGRRVAFAEADLKDEAGKLYATATSTLLIFER